jgi:hypothetical protein
MNAASRRNRIRRLGPTLTRPADRGGAGNRWRRPPGQSRIRRHTRVSILRFTTRPGAAAAEAGITSRQYRWTLGPRLHWRPSTSRSRSSKPALAMSVPHRPGIESARLFRPSYRRWISGSSEARDQGRYKDRFIRRRATSAEGGSKPCHHPCCISCGISNCGRPSFSWGHRYVTADLM